MKIRTRVLILAITAFCLSPHSYAADDTKQPTAPRQSYAVQVGATTVAIIPFGSEPVEVTSISSTHDRATGVSTFTGNVTIIINIAGKPAVTISAAELTLIPQK